VVVFALAGPERGGEYLAGYLIEKSLSVDNVFVFALIFSYFVVPTRHQYRVLFWGVVGALVLRGIFIALGAQLLERYDWMVYVFGKTFPDYKLGWIEVPRAADRGRRRAVRKAGAKKDRPSSSGI
jgi:predicted tellurium resistance membrane protein TerC